MAAITQRLLRLRPAHGHHPYPLRHFSSSDATPPSVPKSEPEPESQSQPSFSSYLTGVKASLQREPPPQNRPQTLRNFSNKHAAPKNEDPSAAGGAKPPIGPSFGDSLRNLRSPPAGSQSDPQGRAVDQLSLAGLKESLKLKRDENVDRGSMPIVGGGDGLPSIFNKEINKSGDDSNVAAMRTQFVKKYNYSELGAKLQMLRPEKKKGNWFSLHELNERLAKLRLIEEKESKVETGGLFSSFTDLRETLEKLTGKDRESRMKEESKVDMGGLYSFRETLEKLTRNEHESSMKKESKVEIGGFSSVKELRETLEKLPRNEHESNMKESKVETGDLFSSFTDLRETLEKLTGKDRERMTKKKNPPSLDIWGQLGGTPSFTLSPPKDELVEKNFRPDNMSSSEKLKLEGWISRKEGSHWLQVDLPDQAKSSSVER